MVKAWVIWKTTRETIWKVVTMKEMILETMLKEDHSEVMMMVITRKEMEATKTLKTAMAQMIIVRVIIAKMVIVKAVITAKAVREMIPTNEEKMIPLPKARTILTHLMVKMRVMILRKMIKMDLDRKMRAITMKALRQLKKTNPSMKMRILIQEIWMI